MRLLLINPNTSNSMTEGLERVARTVAGDHAEITALTAPQGFPYISSRAESQIAGAHVLEVIAEHQASVDAVVIAAFGDPGLSAARELFDLPVVGMSEAAILSAAMLGERFSIVTFSPHMMRWYRDSVRATGLDTRFTGIRCPETGPARVASAATDMRGEIISLACAAISEDQADVVILGGAPLAGLAPEIAPNVPGLLVDPIAAATLQAMALVRLAPNYHRRAARPAAKPSSGLTRALAAHIAGETHGT